ncbi:hypothetical protein B0T24DRAFT_533170 [Lasiosphaeria ovina]|uniref:Zn(2)-C6 fungal-type domain-containing protein n=1 Tax=Lasiosphaeria ovina TaxID=92902 RepID=A0AAE0N3U1_9PEZI|nr:hypothetical protein B0T24DRAFT_533170 [Lasiosphaeria ovina]
MSDPGPPPVPISRPGTGNTGPALTPTAAASTSTPSTVPPPVSGPRLRPLLPADLTVPGSASSSTGPSAPKRRAVLGACTACRRRKSKASIAGRPKCTECLRRGTECSYDTSGDETPARALKRKYADLENQTNVYESIYKILATRPESEVAAILRRIRAGEQPEAILRHVQHGDLLLQLSVVPEFRYRYEFPFMVKFPARLQTPGNVYLSSLVYEWDGQQSVEQTQDQRQQQAMVVTEPAFSMQPRGPCSIPFHAAEVIDPLVDEAEPFNGTSVSPDNSLVRSLLRAYFLHEYNWYTCFQKDCFLEDMDTGRRRFCSSSLVDALLAMACFRHRGLPDRAEFRNPHTLGYQFHAEAKRLWELEQNKKKLTTIQAAILPNMVYNSNGADKLGQLYILQAISIARELVLFKRPDNWDLMDPKIQTVWEMTTWGLYGCQCEYVYHFLTSGTIKSPPEMGHPDVAENPEWYGEVRLRYPLRHTLYPMNFGHFFKALSGFRAFIKEVGEQCFLDRQSVNRMPSLANIMKLYSRLETWYTSLPEPLSPRRMVFPGQMKLRMHYQHVVMNIFQPLVRVLEGGGDDPTSTPPSPDEAIFGERSAREVLTNAKIHYETILRLYYLRHGSKATDSFLLTSLTTLSFRSIGQINSDGDANLPRLISIRPTLILCAQGLYDQGRSWFLPQTVFRLVRDGMLPAEADLLIHFANIPEEALDSVRTRSRHVRSAWPVNIVDVTKGNPEQQQLTKLLEACSKLKTESLDQESEWKATVGPKRFVIIFSPIRTWFRLMFCLQCSIGPWVLLLFVCIRRFR